MKLFELPAMEMIRFSPADVITTSGINSSTDPTSETECNNETPIF